jgi:hypothetical protein
MFFDAGRVGRQTATKTRLMSNAGVYTSPSLDLNFMVPGVLDPRITFTRASTATYTDANGVIQTAAVNAPRWDYDPTTHALKGLLIEEARTNIVLQSADMSNAAWVKSGFGPSVTGNQVISPDGTLTASRAIYPAITTAPNFALLNQPLVGAAQAYTFSVWLRGNTGGEQIYLCISGPAFYSSPRITLTTVWTRYVFVTPVLVAATQYFAVGADMRDPAQSPISGGTIYVWGAQVEQGAFATSYIPTTAAAVTRAQDNCAIPPANMAWFVSPGGSWLAEFIPFTNGSGVNARIIGVAPGGIAPMYVSPSSQIAQFDGAGMNALDVLVANLLSKASTTWALGQAKANLNGSLPIVSAALATGYGTASSSGVTFMGTSAAPEVMSGYLRRVQYWPRALSDAEMQQVTT